MAEVDALPEETQQVLESLGATDIAIGIPSYNNAETIRHVVETIQAGLAQHFPSYRSVLINADGGSKDGTCEQVLEVAGTDRLLQVAYPVHPVDRLHEPYGGPPGKVAALRSIFEAAQKLGAKSCAIVDSTLSSIKPEWIGLLVRPILEEDFDLVNPCYLRHKFDGTITSGIVYPLTRTLYGKRIRQPMGTDFAVSPKLMQAWLTPNGRAQETARSLAEIDLSTHALCGNFRVSQTFLGARTRVLHGAAPDLSSILADVVGCLFGEMIGRASVWQKIRGSAPIPIFGSRCEISSDSVAVNVKPLIETFCLGSQNLQEVWGVILPPATLLELKKMARLPEERFRFQDEVWARALYDFALGYRMRAIGREHLLRALTPLYSGWLASFVLEMQDSGSEEVERRLEKLCLAFEAQKPYLISRWRWPDRFNP